MNDHAAYTAYSNRFAARSDAIIDAKYDSLVREDEVDLNGIHRSMQGVGEKRKAKQRAFSDIANDIMLLNDALNVCICCTNLVGNKSQERRPHCSHWFLRQESPGYEISGDHIYGVYH